MLRPSRHLSTILNHRADDARALGLEPIPHTSGRASFASGPGVLEASDVRGASLESLRERHRELTGELVVPCTTVTLTGFVRGLSADVLRIRVARSIRADTVATASDRDQAAA